MQLIYIQGSKYNTNFTIAKNKAPYPNAIELKIPIRIFTSPIYIKNLTILVGTMSGCCN